MKITIFGRRDEVDKSIIDIGENMGLEVIVCYNCNMKYWMGCFPDAKEANCDFCGENVEKWKAINIQAELK